MPKCTLITENICVKNQGSLKTRVLNRVLARAQRQKTCVHKLGHGNLILVRQTPFLIRCHQRPFVTVNPATRERPTPFILPRRTILTTY